MPVDTLEREIRAAGWPGEWDAAGVDRYAELAGRMRAAGITTLAGGLRWSTAVAPATMVDDQGFRYALGADGRWSAYRASSARGVPTIRKDVPGPPRRLVVGNREVGYLGDANNDGSIGKRGKWLQAGYRLAWSARGHGNVSYWVTDGPAGLQIVPTWGSSSDAASLRTAAIVAASMAAMAYALPAGLGEAAGAAEGAAGAAGAAEAAAGAAEAAAGVAEASQAGSLLTFESTAYGSLPEFSSLMGGGVLTDAGAVAVTELPGFAYGGELIAAAGSGAAAAPTWWDQLVSKVVGKAGSLAASKATSALAGALAPRQADDGLYVDMQTPVEDEQTPLLWAAALFLAVVLW